MTLVPSSYRRYVHRRHWHHLNSGVSVTNYPMIYMCGVATPLVSKLWSSSCSMGHVNLSNASMDMLWYQVFFLSLLTFLHMLQTPFFHHATPWADRAKYYLEWVYPSAIIENSGTCINNTFTFYRPSRMSLQDKWGFSLAHKTKTHN